MIRPIEPPDIEKVWSLIQELAAYEKLSDAVTGSADQLAQHIFKDKVCQAYVATEDDQVVGYAIVFFTYSTFRTQPGMWLEDLYVTPLHRGKGHGKALLKFLAAEVDRLGHGRLEWSVLDWNEPAIEFYKALGATIMPDWRICRLSDQTLSTAAKPITTDR